MKKKYHLCRISIESMRCKFYFVVLVFLLCATSGFAHAEQQDFLRSMGKMYVVVAILMVIFFVS